MTILVLLPNSNSTQWTRLRLFCTSNPNLSMKDRVMEYTTPGSLTRHFLQVHVNPPWPTEGVECNVCRRELLQRKVNLLNHTEAAPGTVVRGYTQERLALELQYTQLGSNL